MPNRNQTAPGNHPGNEAGYAEILHAPGREYDRAREQEQAADTDTRQVFCAGMTEAYKNALAILSGHKEE
jgi:hypothetical protein